MAFHVGQKVVCVDASPAEDGFRPALRKGSVYTVVTLWVPDILGQVGISLKEIADAPERKNFRGAYRASRFRPAVEKKTDTGMAILREILDRENVDERAPAKVDPQARADIKLLSYAALYSGASEPRVIIPVRLVPSELFKKWGME